MKTIHLTRGKVAIVDDDIYERLSKYRWTADQGRKTWYAVRFIYCVGGARIKVYMHREIADAPDGYKIDHRDGDGLNNQRFNLRLATHAQNMSNRGANRNNTSGFKGVTWFRPQRRWCAEITVNGRKIRLGYFATPEAAHAAYCEASKKHHGRFGRTG